ncbi:hypothetical protein QSE00_19520 [Arenibacter sp. M-2]|uniref:hypothetical protein n=1 Tax=Arenibacter sp. M-2 TaxID=3053612 RepID=UPI002570CC27|nr:hypothetical protein [Arenibacter sp. M-2]MDL5514014.1 hypothetical protein [Arenibacter sp. M-2]
MSKIFQTNIRNSDRNYLFTLDWDDRSFVQGYVAVVREGSLGELAVAINTAV